MKGACLLVVLLAVCVPRAARADWWTNADTHPREIAPGTWYFSINVPVQPVGELQFVNAQYDFYDFDRDVGTPTDGIAVDYAYDGADIDWTDGRTFLAIAPTLFDEEDGFIQGWSAWDLKNGKFEGTVYATAPLLRVSFTVAASEIVHGRRRR